MPKKVRVGVIGCGAIAQRLHVPDYATTPEAEIVALCDRAPGVARSLAERWAPGAALYTDHRKMLKEANLDAVTVTLPNVLHCPVTLDVLRSGRHVLVEKPMATTAAECRRMVRAAEKAGRLLMVNQCQRRSPLHLKAKEVMDSGILGKVLLVTAMFGHEGPENWSPDSKWFFKKKDAMFGAMADLGVHKADLVRFLTGKEIAEVSAYSGRLEKKRSDVEDNFVSCLTFEDGTFGTLTASWTAKGMDSGFTIFHCENGSLRVGVIPGKPLVANLVKPESEIVFDIPHGPRRYEDSWEMDVSGNFVRSILGLEEPFCTGEEGMRSMDVIFAAAESAKTGRSVKVRKG